jgi:hypothetical protein
MMKHNFGKLVRGGGGSGDNDKNNSCLWNWQHINAIIHINVEEKMQIIQIFYYSPPPHSDIL